MGALDERPSAESSVFHSTPRLRIFLRGCLSTLAFGVWVWIMDKHEVDFWPFRTLGLFLMVSSVALFVLALRRSRTVVLDGGNFVLVRGKKQTTIPWSTFADQNSKLKLENVLGWQRLNIKAVSGGKKTALGIDRIFGAGLPVPQIAAIMRDRIETVCGREPTID
jgi:hypothetical protein